MRMRERLRAPLLLLLLQWLACCSGHMVEVKAGAKECFFEDLHINDKMTVTYQVGNGGNLDIDFWLGDPRGVALHKDTLSATGTASVTVETDGRYIYCFSNEMSTLADKLVSFNVHGIIYVQDDGTIAPIEREVRDLASGLQAVKDEQEYIVVRERRHRDTAESTNSRVVWWSVFQGIVLFSVCAWQIYYLQSFFEVKRNY